MSRIYDNWERLVDATLKREQLRQIALCDESLSSTPSDFSFDSLLDDVAETPGLPSNTGDSELGNIFYIDESIVGNPLNETKISNSTDVQFIAFKELQEATKNFRVDWIIGMGGFGDVYKGWMHEQTLTASNPGAGIAVAIKKKNPNYFLGPKEWLTEIGYLRHLHHPNLVKLIGYCCEQDDLLLVYEFMPKGSLENHLFRRGHQSLSWATRIKVAIGAARGLSFLHDSEKQVIHGHIKTANIVLDGEFNAKLAAFGLAKDGPVHVSTKFVGTLGYAAPEYLATGQLTARCDVYGFGVVLLELLSGRCVIDQTKVGIEQNLVEWARPFLAKKKRLFHIMDPKLETQYHSNDAYTAALLALRCASPNPPQRPHMTEVLAALERLPTSNN